MPFTLRCIQCIGQVFYKTVNTCLVYKYTQFMVEEVLLGSNDLAAVSIAFYPRDAMLARSLRQRRVRPSVCLSVTRRYCA